MSWLFVKEDSYSSGGPWSINTLHIVSMDTFAPSHSVTHVRVYVSSAMADFNVYVGKFEDEESAGRYIEQLSLRLAMSRGVVRADDVKGYKGGDQNDSLSSNGTIPSDITA